MLPFTCCATESGWNRDLDGGSKNGGECLYSPQIIKCYSAIFFPTIHSHTLTLTFDLLIIQRLTVSLLMIASTYVIRRRARGENRVRQWLSILNLSQAGETLLRVIPVCSSLTLSILCSMTCRLRHVSAIRTSLSAIDATKQDENAGVTLQKQDGNMDGLNRQRAEDGSRGALKSSGKSYTHVCYSCLLLAAPCARRRLRCQHFRWLLREVLGAAHPSFQSRR